MDLGIFVRSKTGLRLWLAVPLAAVALTVAGGIVHLRRGDRDVLWRQEFLSAAPRMRAVLNRGLALVDNTYATVLIGEEARERLNATLNGVARDAGFTINTLSIEEAAGLRGTLRATVRGEGRLAGILQFVDSLERPERLIALESVAITATRPSVNPPYGADLTLRYVYNPRQK